VSRNGTIVCGADKSSINCRRELRHLGGSKNLQARIEVFNIPNTRHFANPNGNIANVVYNADGSILSLNGFAAVTGTNSLGREYDERYIRLGVRLSL
jgi:hypothetical protein